MPRLIRDERLIGVNQQLQDVVRKAVTRAPWDILVVEGLRTVERQKKLVEAGASWTMNSRHLTGRAVDLAPYIDGGPRWDWPLFYKLADAMKTAARELGVGIVWGGDWRPPRRDGPHFELKA